MLYRLVETYVAYYLSKEKTTIDQIEKMAETT